ncbi:MAG: reactive intermediate/imine deaminase [Gammaproteobacteria bacterium]|nr:reactive intermediate/imine deaminase [Gammaproteobacteria bacterium]MDG2316307.1 RidA family protein [Gammaproteobacteria bacterium]|tara:strand:+ start:202 stop:582 length:381 start_codon:yes stop_codon:yes gene_type:complete
MKKQIIHTNAAPAALGPYSQAVRVGDTVYISGQTPLDPSTMELVSGGINAQAQQVFENLSAIARAAESELAHAVKLTIYLTDLDNFQSVNKVMLNYFEEPFPARVTVGVASLPKAAAVEIDAILVV